jgi:hypothetical protein
MKRLFAAMVGVLVVLPAFGVDKAAFDEVVDFDMSIEQLAVQAHRSPDALMANDAVFVVDGVVSTVNVLDPNPESFRAEVDLVAGEWRGLRNVVMYKARVLIEGEAFAPRIPGRRRGQEPPAGFIERNGRVLVVGSVTSVADDPETGRGIPVIDGFYVRTLQ